MTTVDVYLAIAAAVILLWLFLECCVRPEANACGGWERLVLLTLMLLSFSIIMYLFARAAEMAGAR